MIAFGLSAAEKAEKIAAYRVKHDIRRVVVIGPEHMAFDCGADRIVTWEQVTMYEHYYPLLQGGIDGNTLLVLNECLRKQDRNCLDYNCIRLYANQTSHVMIFQWLPLIDSVDDFATLFDFDTKSRWKRASFHDHLAEVTITGRRHVPAFTEVRAPVSGAIQAEYARKKRELIDGIGLRDPHTIPRNLYLLSGKSKLPFTNGRRCIGRNNRFGGMTTYDATAFPDTPYRIFEFPHAFGDFADFMAVSGQVDFEAITTDLKVDQWYLDRYQKWADRLRETYAILGVE